MRGAPVLFFFVVTVEAAGGTAAATAMAAGMAGEGMACFACFPPALFFLVVAVVEAALLEEYAWVNPNAVFVRCLHASVDRSGGAESVGSNSFT